MFWQSRLSFGPDLAASWPQKLSDPTSFWIDSNCFSMVCKFISTSFDSHAWITYGTVVSLVKNISKLHDNFLRLKNILLRSRSFKTWFNILEWSGSNKCLQYCTNCTTGVTISTVTKLILIAMVWPLLAIDKTCNLSTKMCKILAM